MTNENNLNAGALEFLKRDFSQCFLQMRHYDNKIFNILKFMFTGYSAIVGLALGLYQFGLKEHKNLSLPAIAILSIGFILGLLLLELLVKNRVYYVRVSRYINEIRNYFFQNKPIGFDNHARMYTDYNRPRYFNKISTHIWLAYILSFLNSSLLGVLLYILFHSASNIWTIVILNYSTILIIQIIFVVSYFKAHEKKTEIKTGNKNS